MYRSRRYFPVKHDESGSRERQVTRQEITLQQRKRKTSGPRDCPSHMDERASVSTRSARDARTLHRFDKLTWKATSMIGSLVQRIMPVLTSLESSFSILEPQCPWEALICCREFKKRTRRPVVDSLHIPCHHFVFPSRKDKSRRVFCLCRTCPGKSYFTFEC